MNQRRKWLAVAGLLAALAAVYLVSRFALPALYTPEWSARTIFWPCAAVVLLPALFGKPRFSAGALAGYVAGMIAGELLGGWEADVGPQYLHHGWWIMLLVFAAGCVLGALAQRRGRTGRKDR